MANAGPRFEGPELRSLSKNLRVHGSKTQAGAARLFGGKNDLRDRLRKRRDTEKEPDCRLSGQDRPADHETGRHSSRAAPERRALHIPGDAGKSLRRTISSERLSRYIKRKGSDRG